LDFYKKERDCSVVCAAGVYLLQKFLRLKNEFSEHSKIKS